MPVLLLPYAPSHRFKEGAGKIMNDARYQLLITPTSKAMTMAELFNGLRREVVIFLKDAEMYLYFCIARYIVWKKVRRDNSGKNGKGYE